MKRDVHHFRSNPELRLIRNTSPSFQRIYPVENLALAKYFVLIFPSKSLQAATLTARPIVGEDRKEGVKLAAEVTRPQLRRSLERALPPSLFPPCRPTSPPRKINLPALPRFCLLSPGKDDEITSKLCRRERQSEREKPSRGKSGGCGAGKFRMWTFWNEKHFAAESIVLGEKSRRKNGVLKCGS